MHTWIFGGGLVRDDDGAKGIVLRRAPLGASRALAKSALLARFWRLAQILLGADAASKGSEAGPRAVLRCVPRL